ncbi:murein L,D-transpeptidase catalytic domain family protein [Frigoriflavimonas asaccharolytica]|uniref:L,D-transpeptidase-like protein n=1 Tax=Frigoriflavimonas asaccharolytica TaxID=2735899 RepID=A0A8J8G870_9FLAO|nr:murein L,D-transpeptidase catalytic domain family protein [Frigoriflavimonas asaccharolytica]NRS92465.1 hypothetical protein [Frigoriflavimonas asaccharolytica]
MQKVFLLLISVLFLSTSFYKRDTRKFITEKNNLMILPIAKKEAPAKKASSLAEEVYLSINFENINRLNADVFYKAFLGFENLKKAGELDGNSHLLTICDFSLSSNVKRLWVIDVHEGKVVFNSLVAHGKNTGEEFAEKFSNTESSLQSSLGFYITESTYDGSNGYSLKLLGMDDGYNDKALERAIVMHGADYVSENFIKNEKRLGRSWGCPAVPKELAEPIINTIKGKNCLFIYAPDQNYLANSKWLKTTI